MKKRHLQKLVLLSITILLAVNIPLLFIYNQEGNVLGFPVFYAGVFWVWALSVGLTAWILNRYNG